MKTRRKSLTEIHSTQISTNCKKKLVIKEKCEEKICNEYTPWTVCDTQNGNSNIISLIQHIYLNVIKKYRFLMIRYNTLVRDMEDL